MSEPYCPDCRYNKYNGDCECSSRANVATSVLRAELTKYKDALRKIGEYETLDGEKYNSYEEGWHGVARFARQILETERQIK